MSEQPGEYGVNEQAGVLDAPALRARLDRKDAAIGELCHELRGQLGELVLLAGGVARYLELGKYDEARAKALQLQDRLKARDAIIAAGRDRALGA